MGYTTSREPGNADPPADPIDALDALGEPFASYGRALLAADHAKQRKHAAQIAGDRAAVRQADLDIDEAVERVYSVKHHLATAVLMSLRFARELYGEDAVLAAADSSGVEAMKAAVLQLARDLAAVKRDLAASRKWKGNRR